MPNGVHPESTDDEARWAEAESLLARAPTESAEQRLRRWRRIRVLAGLAVALLGVALGLVLFLVLGVRTGASAEAPTWQAVTGLCIAGAGLILQTFGLVTFVRTTRRRQGALTSPLSVLTRGQRKELLAQVRGLHPTEAARLPLARALAEQLIRQRLMVLMNVGLAVLFTGQWITSPSIWRALLAVSFAVVLAVAWMFLERDARRAQLFLDRLG